MEFEEALKELKAGKRVTNENWNGKDMFLYVVPANREYAQFVAMKNAQGNHIPWLASQMDLFSDAWIILGDD